VRHLWGEAGDAAMTYRPKQSESEKPTMVTDDTVTAPCKCHKNFAHIASTHSGHCCFVPATQTCHPGEVAAWVQRKENNRD
jgi:hypothetical protein